MLNFKRLKPPYSPHPLIRLFAKKRPYFGSLFKLEQFQRSSRLPQYSLYFQTVHSLSPIIVQSSRLQKKFFNSLKKESKSQYLEYEEKWNKFTRKQKYKNLYTEMRLIFKGEIIKQKKPAAYFKDIVSLKPLLDCFARYLKLNHQDLIESASQIEDFADLTNPHNWFPQA